MHFAIHDSRVTVQAGLSCRRPIRLWALGFRPWLGTLGRHVMPGGLPWLPRVSGLPGLRKLQAQGAMLVLTDGCLINT